jgi:hypothetical protein
MKTIRFLVCGLVACFLPALALAAGSKVQTYTVVGYVIGARPSTEVLAKATHEVETKMAGQKQIQCADDADHSVEVIFKNGHYKVYVDALPFQARIESTAGNRQRALAGVATETHFEQRDHGLPH